MNNFRISAGRGGNRTISDYKSGYSDNYRGGGSRGSYSDSYKPRGYNHSYTESYRGGSRGRGGEYSGTNSYLDRYKDSNFGAAAYNSEDMGRRYGGRGRSNYKKNFNYRGGGYRGRGRGGPGPRSHLDDDDDVMHDTSPGTSRGSGKRYNPYGIRKPSRGSHHRTLAMDRLDDAAAKRLGLPVSRDSRGSNRYHKGFKGGPESWFKVHLPGCGNVEKDFILKTLGGLCSRPFIPVQYHRNGSAAIFYIQDVAVANALRETSQKATIPNGNKLTVLITSSDAPVSHMTEETVEKLKVVMSKRYDPATKTLNLANFHSDEDLKKENISLCLFRQNVVTHVLSIIMENIPELEILDLSSNKIRNMTAFQTLAQKAPNVVRLNLSNNQINHQGELDQIKKLKLVELNLDGNPMCDKFEDETTYVSTIRKRFPTVMCLDGHDLPPPITFDVSTEASLPPSQGSYLGTNEDVKILVAKFVEQYYLLYDSKNRQGLLDAYHDQACFSLTCCTNLAISEWQPKHDGVSWNASRNISRITHPERTQKLLKLGRINILSQLAELPQTEHDLNSFTVDIILLSPSMLIFSIQGFYKEVNHEKDVRTFSRVFVTVPQGSGISIINDQLTITNATAHQKKIAFKTPAAPAAAVAPINIPAPSALTIEQQQTLVQQFSVQSGMNADWSSKCLIENNWDYELSAKVFTDLQGKGAIPPEAFVK